MKEMINYRMLWKRKHLLYIFIAVLLFTTGCFPLQREPEQTIEIDDTPTMIAPTVHVEENYYRGLYPYVASETRGSLHNNMSGFRLDSDRLELGLLEIAQEYFSTDDYLFREGQIIKRQDLTQWLDRERDTTPAGLNPTEGSQLLYHVLEHNYWNMSGDSLEGIVLALSLSPFYVEKRTNDEGEEQQVQRSYTPDELRNLGSELADGIVNRVRNRLNDVPVPIIVALYQLEEEGSFIPGNFLSVGYVEEDQRIVSSWNAINETYLLFPSNALSRLDQNLSNAYVSYRNEVLDFYPNYVGLVGVGRFIDEQLVELTITVSTEFASKTEVIHLTQFLGGRAIDTFDENVHLNIYIQSINEAQAIFIRSAGKEPNMHVYR